MAMTLPLRTLLPATALLLGLGSAGAPPAAADTTENTLFLPVWIAPGGDRTRPEVPALLNVPPGWMAGDAAVVLAPGGDWPPGLRDRLVAALLDARAAVLELNEPRGAGPREAAVRADLAEAIRTMRQTHGAGLVVAIGHGEAGRAALALGTEPALPFAGLVRLGPVAPGVVLRAVDPGQAWPQRAPLLCNLLAGLQSGLATETAAACQDALLSLR